MVATTAFTPTGFTGTVVYSISPDLPDGLLFDTASGVISGTPTTAQASADYTVTASDGTKSATATISLGIASPNNLDVAWLQERSSVKEINPTR